MELFFRIIVILLEVLYYSSFMKMAKKDGKYWRYLLLFSMIQAFFFFVTTDFIYSYLLLILMITFGMKYLVKVETSLYDMLFVFVMMICKLIIELAFAFPISHILHDILVSKVVLGMTKTILVILIGGYINKAYRKLKICWEENKFFIRYIFTIFMFVYVIASCLFLINFR